MISHRGKRMIMLNLAIILDLSVLNHWGALTVLHAREDTDEKTVGNGTRNEPQWDEPRVLFMLQTECYNGSLEHSSNRLCSWSNYSN